MFASNADFGIRIKVLDDATKSLDRVQTSLKGVAKVAVSSSKSIGAIDKATKFLSIVKGLELAKKAFGKLTRAMSESVLAAVQFRSATDPIAVQFDTLSRQTDVLQARLGDVLLNVLGTIGKALGPVIDATTKWLEANNGLIASNIVSWISTVSRAIAATMVPILKVVMGIWAGLKITVATVLGGIAVALSGAFVPLLAVFDKLPAKVQKTLGPIAELGKAFVAFADSQKEEIKLALSDWEKQAEAIDRAADAVVDFTVQIDQANAATTTLRKGNTKSREELAKLAAARAKAAADAKALLDKENAAAVQSASVALEMDAKKRAQLQAFAEYKQGLLEHDVSLQEEADGKVFESGSGSISGLAKAWDLYHQRVTANGKAAYRGILASLTETTVASANQLAKTLLQVGKVNEEIGRIGDVEIETRTRLAVVDDSKKDDGRKEDKRIGQILRSNDRLTKNRSKNIERYIDGASEAEIRALEKAGKKVETITETVSAKTVDLSDAISSIFGNLLDAMLSKIEEFMATAIVGLFLRFVLSIGTGGVGSVLSGAAGQVFGFAGGGLVSGGTPGRDSVPAMLTPGEYVLPAHVVQSIRAGSAPAAPGMFASGGMVSPGGRGSQSAPTVQQNILAFTTSRAQVRRLQRDIFEPERARLKKNRVVRDG